MSSAISSDRTAASSSTPGRSRSSTTTTRSAAPRTGSGRRDVPINGVCRTATTSASPPPSAPIPGAKRMNTFFAAMFFALTAPAVAQDTVKIGLIVDRIGFAKAWSEPISQGAVYAVKELNAKGGILGKKVELLTEDDQSKPDLSATAARKLEADGAAFILSLTHTPAAIQAQTVTVETRTPHLAPSLTVDTLTTQISNPNFWQTGPLASTQIATLLSYARHKSYKRVALVSDNSSISQPTAKAFKNEFDKNGIEVVSEEMLPAGSTSAEAQMEKVRAAKPDAIFSATLLTPYNLLVLTSYCQHGRKRQHRLVVWLRRGQAHRLRSRGHGGAHVRRRQAGPRAARRH